MSAINFPNNPVLNEVFNAAGKSWRWDGTVWVVVPPDEWTRPALWMSMPEVDPTEDKFVGLIAVFDTDANYVELKVDGAVTDEYTVDWGDGNVEDFDYGVAAFHQYDYDDADLTDTSASLGYKQAMVIVTPKGSEPWTYFSLQERLVPGSAFSAPVGWLDIAFSGPNVTTLNIGLED
jgi:hypothetical protein